MTLQEALYKSFQDNATKAAIIMDACDEDFDTLSKKAFAISSYFINHSIKGEIIPLLFAEPESYVYSVLGVLFSENIFMPLDIAHPILKLSYYVSSTKCKYLIAGRNVSREIISQITSLGVRVLYIEDIVTYSDSVYYFGKGEDAIYVYFTSGSTGNPKAVLGKNESLLHFVKWEMDEFGINSSDIFAQLTSPAFDPFLRDIFTPLCAGAKIQLSKRKYIAVPGLLGKFLDESRITVLHTTPSILQVLLSGNLNADYFTNLRHLILAGEPLNLALIKKWNILYGKKSTITNLYGPTEITLAKVFAHIPKDHFEERIPIGKPISGAAVYVMDEYGFECKEGEIGEVHIETEYMTHGYIFDKGNSSFYVNEYNKRCYKTGDLGYLLCGILYLAGRKDDLIKIGGVGIHLNEIKSKVMSFSKDDIKDCVIVYEKGVIYCFYLSDSPIDTKSLRHFLQASLLTVHIPHKFVHASHFPVTVNGKVDKARLLEMNIDSY